MTIVLHNKEFVLLNSRNNVVLTYKKLNKLEDIFLAENGWKASTGEQLPHLDCTRVIYDDRFGVKSFKDLKHNVAAYLIKNNIPAQIPKAYRRAYKRNAHLYNGRYERIIS